MEATFTDTWILYLWSRLKNYQSHVLKSFNLPLWFMPIILTEYTSRPPILRDSVDSLYMHSLPFKCSLSSRLLSRTRREFGRLSLDWMARWFVFQAETPPRTPLIRVWADPAGRDALSSLCCGSAGKSSGWGLLEPKAGHQSQFHRGWTCRLPSREKVGWG